MIRTILTTLLLAAIALAGCSDSGDDAPEPTTSPTETMTTTATTEPMGPAGPMYINGTVTAAAGCSLAAQAGADTGTTESVPPEAWNKTYELTVTGNAAGSVCIAWGSGTFTTSTTGTVPPDVQSVTVSADAANNAQFSIKIE